jgi:hypothetical protein
VISADSKSHQYTAHYTGQGSGDPRHGFIPEEVFQVTSCTTLRTNTFNTLIGNFAYRHLKPSPYFGYHLEEWNDHRYAIAEPERTLIDYLYLHHEVRERKDIEALHWNHLEINNRISSDKLKEHETYIDSPALSNRLNALKTYLSINT